MYRRYTIHRDGDLLVEELDASGKPIEPESVAPEDRLPVEVTVLAPDGDVPHQQLLELLEAALEIERGDTDGWKPKPPGGGGGGGKKLTVLGS
jgi:hypothetical protein